MQLLAAQQGHAFLRQSGAAHDGTLEAQETRYGRLAAGARVRASDQKAQRNRGAYLDRSPQRGVDGQEERGLVAAVLQLVVLTFGG